MYFNLDFRQFDIRHLSLNLGNRFDTLPVNIIRFPSLLLILTEKINASLYNHLKYYFTYTLHTYFLWLYFSLCIVKQKNKF